MVAHQVLQMVLRDRKSFLAVRKVAGEIPEGADYREWCKDREGRCEGEEARGRKTGLVLTPDAGSSVARSVLIKGPE